MGRQRLHTPSKQLVAVCAVAIMAAAIGIAAYNVNTPTTIEHPKPLAPTVQTSIQTIVASLHASLPADFIYLYGTQPDAQTTVGYRLPREGLQVILPTSSPTIAFTDSNSSNEQTTYSDFSKVAASANAYLLQHGFVSVLSQDQTSGLLDAVYFYQRSDAVCQVTLVTAFTLTCSPLALLATIASQARPFVALYAVAEPNSGTALVTAPTIRASQTTGYTIASQPIYNNHGETDVNFYRQGSGAWRMVSLDWYNDPHEDADITPNCADFESNAQVGAAFSGQTCYDSATMTMNTIQ